MRSTWLDVAVGFWVLLAGAAFIVPLLLGGEQPELELVGRCVYLVVIGAGVVGLAFRAIGKVRR